MAIRFQLRRGNTAQNSAFTGSEGELTMDTETGQLKVHDGTTQGGMATVDPLVAFQVPTAENNYVWYRKYASGWVEQGGQLSNSYSGDVVFAIPMADTNYHVNLTLITTRAASSFDKERAPNELYADKFTVNNIGGSGSTGARWEVKGMAA